MKLPDLIGKVITIKSDQKEAQRCHENNLKTRRGISMVTSGPPYTEKVPLPEVSRGTKSDLFGNPGKRKIGEQHPHPNGARSGRKDSRVQVETGPRGV